MASRSATVLVIFVVAVFAFCLASVFAAMTGPISILPNETDSGGILDNLSAITNDTADSGDSYGYQTYDDYSSDDYSSDDSSDVETTTDTSSSDDSSDVETTTDDSGHDSSSGSGSGKDSSSGSNSGKGSSSDSSSSDIETTTDD